MEKSQQDAVKESARIMQRAHEVSEKYKSDAQAEAVKIIAAAREEASTIRAGAEAEVAMRIAEANERLADREARIFAAEASVEEKAVSIVKKAKSTAEDSYAAALEARTYRIETLTRLHEFFIQEAGTLSTEMEQETAQIADYQGEDVEEFGQRIRSILTGDTISEEGTPPEEEPVPEVPSAATPISSQVFEEEDADDVDTTAKPNESNASVATQDGNL